MEVNRVVEMDMDSLFQDGGVYAISLVDEPAIERDWIALSKQTDKEPMKMELKVLDEEKRIVMGAALIPNKMILRKGEGEEMYYIYFTSKTIEKVSMKFMKDHYQDNATVMHDFKLQGATVVESWIVEDAMFDKSYLHGLDLDPGSWVVSMHIENDEAWSDVKSGKLKGFSIEGMFGEKINGQVLS